MSNKSGIAENIISLPKGGGAQKGLGETFSPDLFSGTGNFSFPIAVPPGRNGLQPSLTVGYSSGNGNSEYGLGWGLSVPGITRKSNRGIPIYDDQKDTFILSGAEDLIPIDYSKELIEGVWHFKTKYKPRTEGLFAIILHHKTSTGINYWEVRSKDGLKSYYGNPQAVDNSNSVIANPNRRDHIFAWKLYRTVDVFGNDIIYSYERDLGDSEYHFYDQLYLSKIDYTNYLDASTSRYLCSVEFEYESRPDPFSNRIAGFEIRTTQRIKHVKTYTHPRDGDRPSGYTSSGNDFIDILVKRYDFFFIDERITNKELTTEYAPKNGSSILSMVQVCGFNHESEPEKMPPLEFHYSKFNPIGKDFIPITGDDLPPVSLSNPEYEVADLNGNGLPDIVQINGVTARYWKNKGDGSFDWPKNMKEAPAGVSLAEPGVTLADADGDGRVDLLVNKAGLSGYFTLNPTGEWDRRSMKRYNLQPSFSFQDPEVQLLDMNGDGITDVVKNGSRLEIFYHDRDEGWNDYKFVNKQQLTDFPNVSFSDPRVRFAGVSGGGLQDIMLLHNGKISYWPNHGHGNWGRRVHMKNSPRLPFNFNPARVMLADLDGDGLSDLVYIEDNQITLWVNQSGNAWGEPIVIKGTPRMSDVDSVRAMDMFGTGVPGILWSYDAGIGTRERMYYLDLTGGIKPYLLNEMINNMGALTRVEYRSSIKDYLRDLNHPAPKDSPEWASPWKTTLPMPVLVVGKVEVHDLISKGKLVTEYSYHHGYWDGVEREFRGFARVDQKDTENFERYNKETLFKGDGNGWFNKPKISNPEKNFNNVERVYYSPPILSRSWFHSGPVQASAILGDVLNTDWTELSLANEYFPEKWDGVTSKPITIQRPTTLVQLLKSLPRHARRDALRTMRGAVLRTELYALDGTRFQHKPYTVTEAQYGVRQEFAPSESPFQEIIRKDSGYIFFSFSVGQRTTQWERGNDPMTTYAIADDYDAFGQPQKQLAIAVPRYRNFLEKNTDPPKGYSATYSVTELINKETDTLYLIGRLKQARTWEVVNDGQDDLFTLRDKILDSDSGLGFNLLNHTLNYYDGGVGDEYIGLPLGYLGDYGVPVRSETLVATNAIWMDAYGDIPEVLEDKTSLPGTYPTEFKTLLPDKCGYLYKSSSPHETGYYVEGNKLMYDFHQNTLPVFGNTLAMQDALGHEASISFDYYILLPKTVIDPLGLETEAWYDYRLLTPYKAKDPNQNFSEFAFNALGLLFKSAVKSKFDPDDGSDDTDDRIADDLDHPTALLEYDFFNFIDNGDPVWVKTTQRQYHYYGPISDDSVIISCEYSDGFGRLLQSRVQAEEVIYGNQKFGDSGLPISQTENGACVGIENTDTNNPNVVVNGWQVYNNKGKVVEQYEPFFDKGFDYKPSPQSGLTALLIWQKIKDYIDTNGSSELSDDSALSDYLNSELGTIQDSSSWLSLLRQMRIVRDELSVANDYIDYGDQSQFTIGTNDFTIEFWAWMDPGIDNGDTFVSNRKYNAATTTYEGGFQVRVNTTRSTIQFIVADGSGTNANGQTTVEVDIPSMSAWHHIAWVRKGATPTSSGADWKCYIDGAVASGYNTVHDNLDTGDMSSNLSMKVGSNIGGHPTDPGHFEGKMRDVRLYQRALTQTEVQNASNNAWYCADAVDTNDLLLWVPLDNENNLSDQSQYGQSGSFQLSGHTWERVFNDDNNTICTDFILPESIYDAGQKMRMFYDPRGQVVRTINPDNTEQRVIIGTPHDFSKPPVLAGPVLNPVNDGNRDNYTPSPWINYSFDANDLGEQFVAPDSGLSNLGLIAPDDGTQGYTNHFATPQSNEIDELGRTIKTTQHMGTGDVADDVVMQYEYDIRGNVIRIIDAYDRDVFEHKYDLANQTLWTSHIDSGEKTVVFDCLGRPTELRDAKGSHIINSYDDGLRPIRMWAADNSSQSLTLRNIVVYGDDPTYGPSSPEDTNHLGMPYRSYDEAGLIEITSYDFHGAVLTKKQQVISDTELLSTFPTSTPYNLVPYTVDWVGLSSLPSILDSKVYQTDVNYYDALGRPGITTLPEDVNTDRKELTAEYNRAGGLKKVFFDGTEYIKEMAFNAKGQPLLTAMGNGVMTRYAYSNKNFRLLRSQSEGFTYSTNGTEHHYNYNSGSKKHNTAHKYDLAGNILKILERSTNCGLSSTPDILDRKFSYDPIYRLLSATGRESQSISENDRWNDYTPADGSPSPSACQAYTRNYQYDKMGNILQLVQTGPTGFTRNFDYGSFTNNRLETVYKADGISTLSHFGYDVNGNRINGGEDARNYIWDYADQLKSFFIQSTVTVSEPSIYAQYLYSGGQRVKKLVRKTSGILETTVYIDGVFEHRYNSSSDEQNLIKVGSVATIRIGDNFAGDVFDSMLDKDEYYQLSDHLGSVGFRLSNTGTLIDKEEYYPFGDSSLRTWSSKRYRYVGREKDVESQLYYYGARYYSAWTCRFISTDPLAWKYSQLTPYNYAGNKPINHFDIDGMQSSEGGDDNSGTPDEGTKKFENGITYQMWAGEWTVLLHEIDVIEDRTPNNYDFQNNLFVFPIISMPGMGSNSDDYLTSYKRINFPTYSQSVSGIDVKSIPNNNTSISQSNPLHFSDDFIQKRNRLWELEYIKAEQDKFNSKANPLMYGDPGMGNGLAKDPFIQGAVLELFAGGLFAAANARSISLIRTVGLSKKAAPYILSYHLRAGIASTELSSIGVVAAEGCSISLIAAEAGTIGYRYMIREEIIAVQETSFLRGGLSGKYFYTKDLYKSVASAESRLSLGSSPVYRVEFEILNNPILWRNGTKVIPAFGRIGGGSEFMTFDPIKVRLINWQPLR